MYEELLTYIAIGFAAQIVDGAIGMAYGVVSTSILLTAGIPPATASACVHAAEVFTTGAPGFSHWHVGNVNFQIVKRLALPGAIGGAVGAYILANIDGKTIKPYVAAYLVIMGAVVIFRALRKFSEQSQPPKRLELLGLSGGFIDSIGGGGWGPVVTSSLLGYGTSPRIAIGSVNLAEFFVTLTISAAFMLTIGLELWPIITGLLVGGVIAAPFAAILAKYVPARILMFVVGVTIVVLSTNTILQSIH